MAFAAMKNLLYQEVMKHQYLNFDNVSYKCSASQDGEHAEFILHSASGDICVQVQIGELDREQSKEYLCENVDSPITENSATNIISLLVEQGYIDSYLGSDVGLIYTDEGTLIEN